MNLQQLTRFSLSFVLLLLLTVGAFAQTKDVIGTITDKDSGDPLPGVSIKVLGTGQSTVTDASGKFILRGVTADATISVSFVGFDAKTMKVGDKETLAISMMKTNLQMEDVIVVGYGVQKKAHLTGAVETVKMKEVEDLPVGNLGAALAGRILGLSVSGGTQRPGSRATITVRNPATFAKDGGTTDALYVIDGVVQVTSDGKNDATQFNNLDASEVENISVLKDGAAAIYGSRAANGVILITTKHGKAGAPKFSYSGSYGENDETYRTKMMSANQFGNYFNIMNGPNGSNNVIRTDYKDYVFSSDELEAFNNVNYDWLEPAWEKSHNMRHTMNVSGGSDKATYFAGASYYKQDGNIGYLDYKKWTFRAGADINVATGLKTGLQVSGNFGDVARTFNKVNSEDPEDDYRMLLTVPRYVPMYINGYPVKIPGSTSDKLSAYHFYEINRLKNITETKDKSLMINMYAEYEVPFIKGLKAKLAYSRYFTGSNGTQVGTKFTLFDFTQIGSNGHIFDETSMPKSLTGTVYKNGDRLYYSDLNGETEQTNFYLTYARSFGRHNVSGLVSVEKGEASSTQADVWKESPTLSTNGQFGSAFGAIDGKTTGSESGTLGYIGRLNYSFADKYLAEFLFRTDASTHFAPSNYWGRFYSLSGGWVVSNESFFNVNTINFLKVRYSVGLLGKDDTKAWLWRQRYTYQNGKGAVFGGNANSSTGMKMEASPNPDAHWSNDLKQNLGVDARFLNNRLAVTLEGYYYKSTQMLLERTTAVPLTVGGTIASENFGKMDFYGYEIGLGWNDRVGKDFSYGVDFRFTWSDNKWKQGNFTELLSYSPWNKRAGQSDDNGVWGYDVLGMFKDQADIDAYVSKYGITQVFDQPVANMRPGTLYYADVRGALQADGTFAGPDGKIDANDQVQLAKKADNHYGFGFTFKANYKGIGFDMVMGGSFGGWAEYDGNARKKMPNQISRTFQSRPEFWGDIYDPLLNPTGKYPNPNFESVSLSPTSTFWQVKAFRVGVRNINVNYTIPKKFTELAHVSSARVVFTALNPFIMYNPYSYKAPDGAYDVYPNLRTYSMGVNLGF
jgi:TonB-linked SusC/RagA family outer membrane protein